MDKCTETLHAIHDILARGDYEANSSKVMELIVDKIRLVPQAQGGLYEGHSTYAGTATIQGPPT